MLYVGIARLFLAITSLFRSEDPMLINAIRNGNEERVQQLIAAGADVNSIDSASKTALVVAIEKGDKETYHLLLTKGANPNLCDNVGTSAMHLAAEQADLFWLDEALKRGGKPNQVNAGNVAFPNSTPIFYAIYKKRTENALALMEAGADINHVDGNNNTPLYASMSMGMFGLMIKMIEAGADPKPPQPAFSIFANGWFTENYERTLREFSLEPQAAQEKSKADYDSLKALLIKKGYLKKQPDNESKQKSTKS